MGAAFCTCFVPWWEQFARVPRRFPAGTVIHYDAGAVHSAPLPHFCMLIRNSYAWIYKHEHVKTRHGYFMIPSMIRVASSCYQHMWSCFFKSISCNMMFWISTSMRAILNTWNFISSSLPFQLHKAWFLPSLGAKTSWCPGNSVPTNPAWNGSSWQLKVTSVVRTFLRIHVWSWENVGRRWGEAKLSFCGSQDVSMVKTWSNRITWCMNVNEDEWNTCQCCKPSIHVCIPCPSRWIPMGTELDGIWPQMFSSDLTYEDQMSSKQISNEEGYKISLECMGGLDM